MDFKSVIFYESMVPGTINLEWHCPDGNDFDEKSVWM